MAGDADGGRLVQKEGLQFLVERLLDEGQPISERFRALFALRNHRSEPARSALIRAMRDSSDLLAHEAAFALGQMQGVEAVPDLIRVLFDFDGCKPIVRHEAAEALGAIGDVASAEILKKSLLLDPAQEVRETCELAIHRLEEQGSHEEDESSCPFLSVDPAMPAPKGATTAELREMLLDEKAPMHSRYAALFALRNRCNSEAVEAIVATLESSRSALLKHEIAYVLGQLQDKKTMESLVGILENPEEHPMVRHEAAEALGSIGDARCLELLKRYAYDPEPLVQQSCQVALSMLEFEQQGKPFEYLFQELKSLS